MSYRFGAQLAQDLVLRSDNVSGYILDVYGGVFPFGSAPNVTYTYPEVRMRLFYEIYRVVNQVSRSQVITLFQMIFSLTVNGYKVGQKISKELVLRADGVSGYVLDAYGGVTPFGSAPQVSTTVYW